jgi:hypothetical protein
MVQAAFLLLVLGGVFVAGADCEHWCPLGGVEALATYLQEGDMLCSLGASNFFMLGGVLLLTLLVRRAFCSYVCPIGTLSEWLHRLGRRLRLPVVRVPARVDRMLSGAKYMLLAVILYLTWRAGELIFRGFDPCYALISRHGADITWWAYAVAAAIGLASLVLSLPFCRWFCPLAAVLNPFSRFGWARVQRDGAACRDCGACVRRCPMAIPVDRGEQVTAARCIACLECVAGCAGTRTASLAWGPPRGWGRRWPQAVLVGLVLVCTSSAVAASYLFPLPSFVKVRGTRPGTVAEVKLRVTGVTCRGSANLLAYFLHRDDLDEVPGYLRIAAWPGANAAAVHVTYDPAVVVPEQIKRALVEPYYDALADRWRLPPFTIEGYDPLDAADK